MTKRKWNILKTISLLAREGSIAFFLAIVIAASSWAIVLHLENEAKINIRKTLNTALQTSHESMRNHLNTQKNIVNFWASEKQVQTFTKELGKLRGDKRALINSLAQENLRDWLGSLLKAVDYRGYFVIGNNNLNLASSRDRNIGVTNLLAEQGDFLDRVWAGESLISLPQPSDVPLIDNTGETIDGLATMFVAAPIKNVDGNVIAILAFRLDPDESFSPIFQRASFGDTGDTYAFDSKGLMISESRFNDQLKRLGLIPKAKHSDLHVELRDPGVNMNLDQKPSLPRNKQPLTRMARSATAGEGGVNLDGYRDYRGIPVVEAWIWDKSLGFGFATKIDHDEAFVSFNDTRIVIYIFAVMSMATLIVLNVVSSRGRANIAKHAKELDFQKSSLDEHAIVSIADVKGAITYVNDKFCEISGYSPEELVGQNHRIVKSDEHPPEFFKELWKTISSGEVWKGEIKNKKKNGGAYWVMTSIVPFLDDDGKAFQYISIRTDITERKEIEEALLESEKGLAEAQRIAGLGSWNINLRTGKAKWSDERYRIFGYEPGEVEPTIENFRKSLHPEDRDRVMSELDNANRTGEPINSECRIIQPNGDERIIHILGETTRDKEGVTEFMSGSVLDITETKFLERQLLQSQKLEAVGQLTSGIAHDFNNLLQVSQTNLGLLQNESGLNHESRDLLDDAMRAGQRSAVLIEQLLAFSRKQPLVPKDIDVNQLLEGMLILLERSLGEMIEIKVKLGKSVPLVRVDPTALESAILNLAINARNAMLLGGTLTLQTLEQRFDEGRADEYEDLQPGNYVEICLTDTGRGMEADVLERAFEPFFTTAEIGEGSGLGLSMVYGFSKQSGGHASLDSEPGKGTTVRIVLPATEETNTLEGEQVMTTDLEQGAGIILLVEDDPSVRASAMRLLKSLGYDPIEAEDAKSALEVLDNTPGIDLLFTDIVMPGGMSGVDLAKEALRRNGDLKIAFTSGYPEPEWETSGFPEAGFTFLKKPYLINDLSEAFKSLLAE